MLAIVSPLESALEEVARLRKRIRSGRNRQVKRPDERLFIKATAHAWFQTHRPSLAPFHTVSGFETIDRGFQTLLEWAEKNTTRAKYPPVLDGLKDALIAVRSAAVLAGSAVEPVKPRFAALIADTAMLRILERRWSETLACKRAGADLAATVMLGGLLEALFLARINRMPKQAAVFTAKAAPKDNKTGNPRPLKEWGLKDYLDVGNELGWIRQSAKDVGEVLRDYRNYIHPEKERSHGVSINAQDTAMFITVFGSVAEQIIGSVSLERNARGTGKTRGIARFTGRHPLAGRSGFPAIRLGTRRKGTKTNEEICRRTKADERVAGRQGFEPR